MEKLTESGASTRDEATTKEIVAVAARAVGSLSDADFEIAFNPDVFQDHVKHADPEVRTFTIFMHTASRVLVSRMPHAGCVVVIRP